MNTSRNVVVPSLDEAMQEEHLICFMHRVELLSVLCQPTKRLFGCHCVGPKGVWMSLCELFRVVVELARLLLVILQMKSVNIFVDLGPHCSILSFKGGWEFFFQSLQSIEIAPATTKRLAYRILPRGCC